MRVPATLLLLTVALFPTAARAHGLFWSAGPDSLVLMEGHLPGREHGGEAAVPCDPSRVSDLRVCFCTKGLSDAETWAESAVPAAAAVAVPQPATAVFAVVDWGWWTTTAAGTRNERPAADDDTVLKAWRSRETVKHLERICWAGEADVGLGLEVSPLGGIADLRPGDKLTVRVTLDGRPVAGAVVTCDGKARGATGGDGTIRIKLREPGLQVIRATLRRPAADQPGAEDVQTGTLTFELEGR